MIQFQILICADWKCPSISISDASLLGILNALKTRAFRVISRIAAHREIRDPKNHLVQTDMKITM